VKLISGKLVHQALLSVLLTGFCFVLTGISVAQNQYYVNASSGNDSNDGSQARPWRTIQHADAALSLGSGGAVVHVAPGSYSGPITTNKSGTASARIVFLSDSKWGAKISNTNWVANGSFVEINGFEMTAPGSNGYAIFVHQPASFVKILNNYMHDFTTGDCGSYGVITTGQANPTQSVVSTDNVISGNVIRHAGNYKFGVNSCVTLHGVYSTGKRDIITNNIISGITGWAIKRNGYPGAGIISSNTIFNNGGGISPTEQGDSGLVAVWDYNTVTNNIIVNNGTDAPNGGRFGIDYYHVTGTHNFVSNNLIYGNKPSDYGHHDVTCTGGTPISGSDADGTAGGCPSANPKGDPSPSVTFVNFQSDTNSSPASNYDSDNYQIASGSSAPQNGTTNCAPSPGINPCVPSTDILGLPRLIGSVVDIGAYAVGSSTATATAPSAPSNLTAVVK
jgi:Protein of unknown function (DUF1565)